MWDFMKPKPPTIKPVCQMQPVPEMIKQLEEYRVYVLSSINCVYEKILKELSVTDPKSLEVLSEAIAEYKEIESGIDAKLTTMEEMLNTFIETYSKHAVDDLRLVYDYDKHTQNLSYRLAVKE